MNRLDLALNDYEMINVWNNDFSFPIATTFELMNQKDSALKYYQIYLKIYPLDQAAQQRFRQFKEKNHINETEKKPRHY
jgi:hypothetical protein